MSSAPPGSPVGARTVRIKPNREHRSAHTTARCAHNGWIHELPSGRSGRLPPCPCSAPARPTPRTVPSTGNTLVMLWSPGRCASWDTSRAGGQRLGARPTCLLSMSLWRVLGEHRAVDRSRSARVVDSQAEWRSAHWRLFSRQHVPPCSPPDVSASPHVGVAAIGSLGTATLRGFQQAPLTPRARPAADGSSPAPWHGRSEDRHPARNAMR